MGSVLKVFPGLAIKSTGSGNRDTSQQGNFRADMIKYYNASHLTKPWIWCPVLYDYTDEENIQASQLFPFMNGQTTGLWVQANS